MKPSKLIDLFEEYQKHFIDCLRIVQLPPDTIYDFAEWIQNQEKNT